MVEGTMLAELVRSACSRELVVEGTMLAELVRSACSRELVVILAVDGVGMVSATEESNVREGTAPGATYLERQHSHASNNT